jgi:hypothetical protein
VVVNAGEPCGSSAGGDDQESERERQAGIVSVRRQTSARVIEQRPDHVAVEGRDQRPDR